MSYDMCVCACFRDLYRYDEEERYALQPLLVQHAYSMAIKIVHVIWPERRVTRNFRHPLRNGTRIMIVQNGILMTF